MSVVIIGGHDRMVHQYKKVCKNYNCKAKVFTQMAAKSQQTDRESRRDCTVYQYSFSQNGTVCSGRGGN